MEFSEEKKQAVREILSRYPTKRAAVIPIVHLAQDEFGCVSDEVIEYLAEFLDMSPTFLKDTVSFYTMFKGEKTGKYLIQVCRTLSCSLLGAEHIVDYIEGKLGIDVGETTEDNKFTLVTVECLGSCGTAPVMRINDDYYENLDEKKIDKILGGLE